jgi:hypothetical protein
MRDIFVTAATVALLPIAAATSAAELPSYELAGFPVSPHQWSAVGSANVKEQSASASLTMAGMPASPHQVAVLTPRPRATEELAATNPISTVSFSTR